jgi:hypothetical protein
MGVMRNVYNVLIEKPEGKRTLGRSRRRWKNKIRKHFRLGFIWLRIGTSTCCDEHGNILSVSIKGGEFVD